MKSETTEVLNIERCRKAVEDLREPRPGVYFVDAGISAFVGWCCFGISLLRIHPGLRFVAFVVSALLLYRVLAFIHEVFHQQAMKGFRFFWHVIAGIPLLLPFLLYLPIHQVHHNARNYGTALDGEYEQFKGRRVAMTTKLLGLNLILPLVLVIRFGLMGPLSLLIPKIRSEVIPNFIHLSLRIPYRAPDLKESSRAEAYRVEAACALFSWALVAALAYGQVALVLTWAALVIAIATLNTIRAICSTHLYVEMPDGRDALGQLKDSLNIGGGGFLTLLICPTGLQFHALHHLAPYLPYHALPEAHARLMDLLPPDSDYHQATVRGLFEGWQRLVTATSAR